ncbi:amidinotransferase [Novosphingobium profundi]|nr:amidinotransferase [Novosphingobium profundi]
MSSVQAPGAVVMIRPHFFEPNPQTGSDNAFQSTAAIRADARPALAEAAYAEVSLAADRLEAAGIRVHLFEDRAATRPDSVFPNNWFSTHSGGHLAIFPLFAPNRRPERREDIVAFLKREYRVQEVTDWSGLEHDGLYLEGTGAIVLDHCERVAYTARSQRASEVLLERFCTRFAFEPMMFEATDADGMAIYHTNVMLSIGTRFCVAGLDTLRDARRREELHARLTANGRELIAISQHQVGEFCGNLIELDGRSGPVIALSSRALRAFDARQIARLERAARLVPLDVPTIEMAGGSVRCMLAGIHLAPRPAS